MPKLKELKFLAIALVVFVFLNRVKEIIPVESLKGTVDDLAELSWYGVLISVGGIIFGDHLATALKENAPKVHDFMEKTFFPRIEGYSRVFSETVSVAIDRKELVLRPGPNDVGQSLERLIDERVTSALRKAAPGDQALEDAFRALSEKMPDEAVKMLRPLAATNPEKYAWALLTASAMSNDAAARIDAVPLLLKYGEPAQYLRFAYAFWKDGDTKQAIAVAEKGQELARRTPGGSANLFRNSLAYYYAADNRADRRDLALRDASAETSERKALYEKTGKAEDGLLYASALDTRGYVRIRFARTASEVHEGLADITAAYALDPDSAIYFKHVKAAEAQLATLGSDTPAAGEHPAG
jgi:hypothetical protein